MMQIALTDNDDYIPLPTNQTKGRVIDAIVSHWSIQGRSDKCQKRIVDAILYTRNKKAQWDQCRFFFYFSLFLSLSLFLFCFKQYRVLIR